MLNYLFRRFNLLLVTGFILTIIAFVLTYWLAHKPASEPSYIFDYFKYISSLSRGEWGVSAIDQQPILNKALLAFSSTLELTFLAFSVAIIIAFPLAITAALNCNRAIDYIIMTIVLLSLAIPVFWVAAIATMLPNLTGSTLPIDGSLYANFKIPDHSVAPLLTADMYHLDAFFDRLAHLTLPAAVLSFFLVTEITRLTRHSIIMVMKSNYIKAAYAKGFSSTKIIISHVLKNALPPILHQLRLQLSTIISFTMVIEIIFSTQGAGDWLLNSIKAGDYLALPTAILLIAGLILLTNIVIDILLVIISPVKRKSLYVD